MTAPVEVVVDALVLRGVRDADAPAVVAAFRRHLAEMLAGPAGATGEVRAGEPAEPDELGRTLAAAVVRAVRR